MKLIYIFSSLTLAITTAQSDCPEASDIKQETLKALYEGKTLNYDGEIYKIVKEESRKLKPDLWNKQTILNFQKAGPIMSRAETDNSSLCTYHFEGTFKHHKIVLKKEPK